MTGRGSSPSPAAVHTFRNRQSSEVSGRAAPVIIARTGLCGQIVPNSVASRAPLHFAGGCGAFQRSSPTGGAAKGMPR